MLKNIVLGFKSLSVRHSASIFIHKLPKNRYLKDFLLIKLCNKFCAYFYLLQKIKAFVTEKGVP